MVKILITGGCGFIGTNLIGYLLDHSNWLINVIDDLSQGRYDDLTSLENYDDRRVNFFRGDIRDEADIDKAMDGCDHVVHLAARCDVMGSINNPFDDADVNIIGTLNVLESGLREGVKKIVFASSAAPLGEQEQPVNEEKIPEPLSPYGASKLAGEAYCSAYAGSHGLDTTALRFSNVYGPNSIVKDSVISLFTKQILDGHEPLIYGDGEQTRDLVHVDDISRGIHSTLIREPRYGFKLYQLGTGKETSINEVYRLIKKCLEQDGFNVPDAIHAKRRAGEISRSYCDISKAERELGYRPEIPLEKGIEDTVRWFTENYG